MAISNIVYLAVKELRGMLRDPIMLGLIIFAFTVSIYAAATALPETLNKTPIAIVDEDQSPLSQRITDSFYPPQFTRPVLINLTDMDAGMNSGTYTFTLDIPPNFQRDLLAGRQPSIQLNVDATQMSQAFVGSGYIQTMISGEVSEFLRHYREIAAPPVDLVLRVRFNPTLSKTWFGAVMEIINNVTMLSIVLTGAALLREREHGTIEHLLVMPITPFEIMTSKICAMGFVVLAVSTFSLIVVVNQFLAIPIEGSISLFLLGSVMNLFATTSMGIFMGTIARSMPQFGLLLILVIIPLEMLSGGMTPRENMPELVRTIMLAAPITHFVMLAQSVLFRGAGLDIIWPQLAALAFIGSTFFYITLHYFRKTINLL